jgi:hypothetical protein
VKALGRSRDILRLKIRLSGHAPTSFDSGCTKMKTTMPMYGLLVCPRSCIGRANSQEKPAVVASATPSMLIQLLVSSTATGCFGLSLMASANGYRRRVPVLVSSASLARSTFDTDAGDVGAVQNILKPPENTGISGRDSLLG